MALLQTGLVAGVAPGAALAGIVVDHAGASPAYLVPLGAAVLAAVAARALPAAAYRPIWSWGRSRPGPRRSSVRRPCPCSSAYRQVLSKPGAAAFSASGFLARLPISMVTLGIVLLISARTDSYGLAGGISAAFVIASCLAALLQGRLIDRLGQARVLLPAITICTVSLSLLVWAVEAGYRVPLPHIFAALAGATMPAVGAAVRARWTLRAENPAERQTAFALEAVVDECVFLSGPPLATVLATTVDPAAGLVAAIVFGLVGTLVFCSLRGTEPPPHPGHTDGVKVAMPWRRLLPVALISFALGGLFGSTEVVTVAFAEDLGDKAIAGVLLALWAFGSLLAGFITGAVTWRSGPGDPDADRRGRADRADGARPR